MLALRFKNFLSHLYWCHAGKKWVFSRPVNASLGENTSLPYPKVNQPSPIYLKGGLPEFPRYIAIEVTNVCNLQCKHCNYRYGLEHYTRDRGFITDETMDKVLNEVKVYKIPVLMNYDGEPLMHKNFIEYLRLTTKLGINTFFNTNGTLFDRNFTDRLVEFYRGSIFFSVDGNREWFENIRIPAKYDQVIENLNYFIKVNEEHGWPITVGVSLCNLGQTASEREIFLDEWLPRINCVSMGEVNDKFGTMISNPMTILQAIKRPVCSVPWQTCGICHNGDVIPCSIYITRANTTDAVFGNVHKQSIKEIWQAEAFQRFRKKIAEQDYIGSYCDRCQRWFSQFSFPDVIKDKVLIRRNGYWATYQNLNKGKLNYLEN